MLHRFVAATSFPLFNLLSSSLFFLVSFFFVYFNSRSDLVYARVPFPVSRARIFRVSFIIEHVLFEQTYLSSHAGGYFQCRSRTDCETLPASWRIINSRIR